MTQANPGRADDAAIEMLASRADLARAGGLFVPSPCISVCRIDAVSGLCEGCFRTRTSQGGEAGSQARSQACSQAGCRGTDRPVHGFP